MGTAIWCADLEKRYRNINAVNGVSFSVEPGRVVALLGPNGAGKTTTLRILTTVIRPDYGRASVCGHDIIREPMLVRRAVAIVPQSVWLNHYLSVRDNILVYLLLRGLSWREARRRTSWAMDIFGLSKFASLRCEQLSGGLRRRAQVARVLACQAQCYFLDEPSVGLDPSARLEFWEQLAHLVRQSGATTFISTHSMDEVEALCDDLILINNGVVVASGSVKGLLQEMGKTEVEIEVGSALTTPLEELLGMDVESEIRGNVLTLRMRQAQWTLPRVLEILANSGTVVRSLRVMPPKFQDVYLSLIGQTQVGSVSQEEAGKGDGLESP